MPAAQRETGEVAIEGTRHDRDHARRRFPGSGAWTFARSIRRSRRVARQALLAAYPLPAHGRRRRRRSRSTSGASPTRAVLAAVAERAVATTLVTTEGRALTEIDAVDPQPRAAVHEGGAAAGRVDGVGRSRRMQPAKPVEGADGTACRCCVPASGPTGRTRCRSSICTPATPFVKKGDMQMTLPKMDVPVERARMGAVRARSVSRRSLRRQRDRGVICANARNLPGRPRNRFGVGEGVGAGVAGVDCGTAAGDHDVPARSSGGMVDQAALPFPGRWSLVEGSGRRRTGHHRQERKRTCFRDSVRAARRGGPGLRVRDVRR